LNRPLWFRHYTRTFQLYKSANFFFPPKERIFSRKAPFFSEKSQLAPSFSPQYRRLFRVCERRFSRRKAKVFSVRREKSLWTSRPAIVTIAQTAFADRRRRALINTASPQRERRSYERREKTPRLARTQRFPLRI
jgi:hypothetical protein